MSALPLNLPIDSPVQFHGVADELLLQRLLSGARAGTVVLAADGARFDASIHAIFTPCLITLTALLESSAAIDPRLAVKQHHYPLVVLDCDSIGHDDIVQLLHILPVHVPVVLLHAEAAAPDVPETCTNIVCQLANNASAGKNWSEFQSSRARNNARLVVLDFADSARASAVQNFLSVQNVQVVQATRRLATTFVQSPGGSQVVVLDMVEPLTELVDYIRRLRMSHESDVLGIVVTGNLQSEDTRCELLEAGADVLLDQSRSNRELLIKLFALGRQQARSQQIRSDAYRFPGSVAYNAGYLINVGNKLYASAQRDVMTMALAVIQVVFVETDSTEQSSLEERSEVVQSIARYCAKNLRETDLFAQSGEREFIALVTCVGRNNIARVFNRLSADIDALVARSTHGKMAVRLDMGVTCELGISFTSMIERAQQALAKSGQCAEQSPIVN